MPRKEFRTVTGAYKAAEKIRDKGLRNVVVSGRGKKFFVKWDEPKRNPARKSYAWGYLYNSDGRKSGYHSVKDYRKTGFPYTVYRDDHMPMLWSSRQQYFKTHTAAQKAILEHEKKSNPGLSLPRNKWVNAFVKVDSKGQVKVGFGPGSGIVGKRKK